jgi:hypothetical protein
MTDRRDLARRLAPVVLLLAALALAFVPSTDVLRLAGVPDAADAVSEVVDALPPNAVVLVGFDPDLGTYSEVRPTVRTLLADILDRDARLVFVSLTPEGRALAVAERTRLLGEGVAAELLTDAGFVPGAEAALVALAGAISSGTGALVDVPAPAPLSLVVVVGGNDIGPRSWVEQFAPRVADVDFLAVAPSVLLPELQPLLESGQLRALLATPRDGAAYRESLEPTSLAEPDGPPPAAVLVGMIVAVGALGTALVSRLGDELRASRGREAS